ncbi:hypothetical protein J19TS2_02100 [Cohnella xylanilytica]|uniref:DUF4073 domain-containing protein n=1 Tax=Cohnella xylanilytica TaxID=557555 RepID=UPI001B20DFA1|nr:DUF4073 domain-containing protein [Cohnella xylanilytica]GIO10655.1 hypothetical protein J19TS2_02100 [Cohnella xylanilytica]
MITLTGLKRFFGLFMASILLLPFIAPSARAAADDGRLVVDPTAYSGIPGFRDMQPTRDGGYVAVGGGRMTKLNAAGEKVWAADALPAETELASLRFVRETSDGGFLFAGSQNLSPAWVVGKLDKNGNQVWRNSNLIYQGEATAIFENSGSYLVIGSNSSNGLQNRDIAIVRVDTNGNTMAGTNFQQPGVQYVRDVLPLDGGGYLLVGDSGSSTEEGFVAKLDENGILIGELRTYGVAGSAFLRIDRLVGHGGYFIMGAVYNSAQNALLLKIDDNLEKEWVQTYSGPTSLSFRTAPTLDGGFIVAGGNNVDQGLLVKVNGTGVRQWDKWLDGGGNLGYVRQADDGSYLAAGGYSQGMLFRVKVGAPSVSADDVHNKIVGLNEKMEYKKEGEPSYTPYDGAAEPTFDGDANVLVRYKRDDAAGYAAGDPIAVVFRANPTVDEAASLTDITVAYGTKLADVPLPSQVAVKLSNGDHGTAGVTWNEGAPAYDGNAAGTYTFTGTLTPPEGTTNPDGLKATVRVIVQEKPVVPVTVTEVESLSDLTVAYGTKLADVLLPSQVTVKLSSGDSSTASVTWNEGVPAYDGDAAGTYTFTGTLTPPEGVTNPGGLKATVRVIVQEKPVVPVTVTEVASLSELTVAYGTKLADVLLPSQVTVKLSSGDSSTASVTWNEGAPAYDGDTAGAYTFIGTLTPPEGVTNPGGLKATVRVIVQEKPIVPVTVTEVESLSDQTVAYGTKLSDVPLPSQVTVKLSNGDHGTAGVTWNEGVPAYDGDAAGTYTFTGTLTPPEGVTNPGGLKATVRVIVQEKPVVPVTVTEVESLSELTVAYGTKLADVPLPSQVTVKLSNGDHGTASVTWNEGAPAYVGNAAGTYTFTGTLTPPEGATNPGGLKATVRVIVQEKTAEPDPDPIPLTVASVPSLSDIKVPYGTKLSSIPLPAQTEALLSSGDKATVMLTWNDGEPVYNGRKAGTYVFAGTLALPDGISNPAGVQAAVRVIVAKPTVSDSTSATPVQVSERTTSCGAGACSASFGDEVEIYVPEGVFDGSYQLTIRKLGAGSVQVPGELRLLSPVFELLASVAGDFKQPVTLRFKFNPDEIGDARRPALFYYDEKDARWVEVEGRAENAMFVAKVGHFTKFAVFSAEKKEAPEKPEKPEKPIFEDTRNHWAESSIREAAAKGIVQGYSDGRFEPDAPITRAEFTVMLARALGLAAPADNEPAFADASAIGAWARGPIAAAAQAGLATGFADGTFRPGEKINRAEMAAMIARTQKFRSVDAASEPFADEETLPAWVREAAAAVREAGIVTGADGNRFAPNERASRAEAAAMLLRMLDAIAK